MHLSEAFSIIVPVFDEECGLVERVSELFDGLPESCEVIYICNGCTDRSETILRSFSDNRITVLNCPKGKSRALRMGERYASRFPRFFVDSDVSISGASLVRLAAVLDNGIQLVSPAIVFDLSGASWYAEAVNTRWLSLPHGRNRAYHHVLGITEQGRARWADFPDVIADDSFIESHFSDSEKMIARHVTVVTRPPRCLPDWIRVRIRWRQGDLQLRRKLGINLPKTANQNYELFRTLISPKTAFTSLLYLVSVILVRIICDLRPAISEEWVRDNSSRNGAG